MTTPTGFTEWLRRHGYREATIQQYAASVESLTTKGADGLRVSTLRQYARGWDALRKWQSATGQQVSDPVPLPEKPINPRARGKKRRSQPRAWPEATWLALLERARRGDEPVDAALAVMLSTGMRASDVLRIRRSELAAFRETGRFVFEAKGGVDRDLVPDLGQADDVEALASRIEATRGNAGNVAAFVTQGASDSTLPSSAAYQRMRKRLKEYCRELGLPPLRLHDARHTIALRVYERSAGQHPELAVMALLGHANLQTTLIYLRSLVPTEEARASVGVPRRTT